MDLLDAGGDPYSRGKCCGFTLRKVRVSCPMQNASSSPALKEFHVQSCRPGQPQERGTLYFQIPCLLGRVKYSHWKYTPQASVSVNVLNFISLIYKKSSMFFKEKIFFLTLSFKTHVFIFLCRILGLGFIFNTLDEM